MSTSAISLLVCLAAVLASAETEEFQKLVLAKDSSTKLIGYYDANSQKELHVDDVPTMGAGTLTHVVLMNAVTVDSAGLVQVRPSHAKDELSGEQLIEHLATPPSQLIIGLTGGSTQAALASLAKDPVARLRLATDLVGRLRSWGAAGLEVAWPTEAASDEQLLNMTILTGEIARVLHQEGGMTLSVSVQARPGRTEFFSNVQGVALGGVNFDWFSVRPDPLRTPGDPHHASMRDADAILSEWTSRGVPAHRLVLGTPLFALPGNALSRSGTRDESNRMSWSQLAGVAAHKSGEGVHGDHFTDPLTGNSFYASGLDTTRAKVNHIVAGKYAGMAFCDLHHDSRAPGMSLVELAGRALKDAVQGKQVRKRFTVAHIAHSLVQAKSKMEKVVVEEDDCDGEEGSAQCNA